MPRACDSHGNPSISADTDDSDPAFSYGWTTPCRVRASLLQLEGPRADPELDATLWTRWCGTGSVCAARRA